MWGRVFLKRLYSRSVFDDRRFHLGDQRIRIRSLLWLKRLLENHYDHSLSTTTCKEGANASCRRRGSRHTFLSRPSMMSKALNHSWASWADFMQTSRVLHAVNVRIMSHHLEWPFNSWIIHCVRVKLKLKHQYNPSVFFTSEPSIENSLSLTIETLFNTQLFCLFT